MFRHNGHPIGSVKTAFAKAVHRAEIPHATPHDMRRTFATRLHNEGVPMAKIQNLLGHGDVSTTMRYIGVTAEDLDTAMDALASARSRFHKEHGASPLSNTKVTYDKKGVSSDSSK